MKTLVLLSGGLDSTAALLAARREAPDVEALFIYYGQPAGQREQERALAVTRELAVPFHRIDISSAYYGGMSAGLFKAAPSGHVDGVDVAFVPVRNPLLLATAAARALTLWPLGPRRPRPIDAVVEPWVGLVVGFNGDDAGGFPDCTAEFVDAFEHAVNLGLGYTGAIRVIAPWVSMKKAGILRWVREHAPDCLPLIEASWSCYRERGPCGECTACVTRATALRQTAPA
jgi:7-cyano-7-deazaguanine synthase